MAENRNKSNSKSIPSGFIILIVKLIWTTIWQIMMSNLAPRSKSGKYIRPTRQFHNFIGTEPDNPYTPAPGRYDLYVGFVCLWAHRTLFVRLLKGLQDVISIIGNKRIWVMNQESEVSHPPGTL